MMRRRETTTANIIHRRSPHTLYAVCLSAIRYAVYCSRSSILQETHHYDATIICARKFGPWAVLPHYN